MEEADNQVGPKKKPSFRWRDLFVNKVFDLFIVIAGVTIAIQVESLKQESDKRTLERFYLASLAADLDKDITECEDNLGELKLDMKLSFSIVRKIELLEPIEDSLGLVVLNITSIKTFEGHRNTYTTILNTNGLSFIEDETIRNLLSEYYRSYTSIERFETSYSEFTTTMQDYFIGSLDYNHLRKIVDTRVYKSMQTKNLLVLAAVRIQQGVWRYEPTISKAKELRTRIANALEN